MPHFIIEYSANVGERTDIGALVELVRQSASETGVFPLGGIRVRAIRCDNYAIGNGDPAFGFLAMTLRLGAGRDAPTRKTAGDHVFNALSSYLDPVFRANAFSLSFEMVEIAEAYNWKRNNIHEHLQAKVKATAKVEG